MGTCIWRAHFTILYADKTIRINALIREEDASPHQKKDVSNEKMVR